MWHVCISKYISNCECLSVTGAPVLAVRVLAELIRAAGFCAQQGSPVLPWLLRLVVGRGGTQSCAATLQWYRHRAADQLLPSPQCTYYTTAHPSVPTMVPQFQNTGSEGTLRRLGKTFGTSIICTKVSYLSSDESVGHKIFQRQKKKKSKFKKLCV